MEVQLKMQESTKGHPSMRQPMAQGRGGRGGYPQAHISDATSTSRLSPACDWR